jgi:hypothetical protein
MSRRVRAQKLAIFLSLSDTTQKGLHVVAIYRFFRILKIKKGNS